MSRKLLLTALSAALLLTQAGPAQTPGKKSALDKATLESYVRHLWVLGPELQVAIQDPKPSTTLPGFKDVTVRITQGAASQEVQLLVSSDGSRILQGSVYNIANNPFKPELDKLKTQFQPSYGSPGAPVVLVLFSDMQCPYCKTEAKMLRDNLVKTYPKEVRLYFKDYPLEQLHPWAMTAAIAGRCVFNQNPQSFWDYHDWIFGKQEAVTLENVRSQIMDWAKSQKDIDSLQLGRCIDQKETFKDVQTNMAEARSLSVDGTPALFVNGRRVNPQTDWDSLKRIIDFEIQYQKVAKNAGEDCGCETNLNVPGLPSKTPGSPLTLPAAGKKK